MLGKLVKGAAGYAVPFWGQVKAARSYLTMLVVASAAAFLYWKFATVQRERDQLEQFATLACATAGAEFDATVDQRLNAKGKAITVVHKRGELCLGRVRHLTAFELEATKASNSALAGALQQHATKSEADASSAAHDAATAAAAAQKMEQIENDIQGDRVGDDWFDAINGLAGLRPNAG